MNYKEFSARQKSFNHPDGNISYIDIGSGKPILLLHGFPVSSWIYNNLIDELSNQKLRVIAPDLLGFGNSDGHSELSAFDTNKQANRIIALMDYLDIQNWTQVVHDVGGLWSWELLNINQSRVSNLILLNTIITEEGLIPPFKSSSRLLNRLISKMYGWPVINNFLCNQLLKQTYHKQKPPKSFHEGIIHAWNKGNNLAIEHFLNLLSEPFPDYSNLFKILSCNVGVIWGKYDEMLSWDEQSTKVTNLLRIAPEDVFIIEGKHYIQDENFKEVSNHIMSLLNRWAS